MSGLLSATFVVACTWLGLWRCAPTRFAVAWWSSFGALHAVILVAHVVAARPVLASGEVVAVILIVRWLWRNRRRKDRTPSKVAGVVRDLGHRLTVAPVPAGAT